MRAAWTSCVVAAIAFGGFTPTAVGETLKEGMIACRNERAVVVFEELERTGDEHQKEMLVGTACLKFNKDMEAKKVGESTTDDLVRIVISNGRRSVELWTRPDSLDTAVG